MWTIIVGLSGRFRGVTSPLSKLPLIKSALCLASRQSWLDPTSEGLHITFGSKSNVEKLRISLSAGKVPMLFKLSQSPCPNVFSFPCDITYTSRALTSTQSLSSKDGNSRLSLKHQCWPSSSQMYLY
ncbi:hypothetical protein HELRODRAFT_174172 [Helobdella robusta]|uniref:Uncharacterized protein n=1 Tax=Helobdella robusta TaxID=6412 RepID=T1F7Q7_HELRO|nr:hypothetical protein HELRODRAFT_174172 [Helobdella robusta]ESO02765.1 hypothetical protein HELRODRAFT_174172 [Helobdella robusta]